MQEFEKVLKNELSVIVEGERYDYTKDLKTAYHRSLAKSTE
jgi:hypothetical protein